ncbi:hypothetical protein SDC9_136801 [bioreactor metagenome]|uniref:Uncharacterized protein n=1 Tax=bioreactor metagenome TaxID=1076179 RepID=A0A645DK60_9ZZZZ
MNLRCINPVVDGDDLDALVIRHLESRNGRITTG